MDAYECFMETEFGGARSRDRNFREQKWAKKLTNLNRCILVITDIDKKRFVIFDYTINHLSFSYVRLPQFEYYCIFLFFYVSFFPMLSTFKLLNALHSKFA